MTQKVEPPADTTHCDAICQKAIEGVAISSQEALTLYRTLDLSSLGLVANAIRQRMHPGDKVTYIIDRNVNPTNVCITDCGFCAFYRRPGDPEAYELPREVIYQKIDETISAGGNQLLLQGGHHPYLKTADFAQLFRDIKDRYPSLWIHGMSPPEIHHLSLLDKRPVREVIAELKEAGLDSVPGGGAEILVERVRQIIAPKKASTEEWLDVMRQAAGLGLRGTATMMFGHVETDAERIEHLDRIRQLQDECGVFTAFIPWTYQPENTEMAETVPHKTSVAEYLRTLAIARIYLHNVQHVQASFVTQGMKTCQAGLAMGADDFGSVMLEENVVSSAGCSHPTSVAEIERHIKDAGYTPQRRTMLYEHVETPATNKFGNLPRKRGVVSSS
ncbi:MAG: cyclic dehypoxanthinyl futalosine synthase [Planctomycetota bacterium]|nr:cyclic dehypoxanthinyl futalosine synthase [Planctomycetota bacterium]